MEEIGSRACRLVVDEGNAKTRTLSASSCQFILSGSHFYLLF